MPSHSAKLKKLMLLAMMTSLDVVLSPLFRIEGMAPMSSVINVIAAVLMGPLYATLMALACGVLRMMLLGIPPLALTGAVFGAFFAGIGYRWGKKSEYAMLGELIGTGIIGSLLSYPVMVWFTGSAQELYWFVYTPRFVGAAIIGSSAARVVLLKLQEIPLFISMQHLFFGSAFESHPHGLPISRSKIK